jgi:predicted  nucleic acid-binding Zn-ribbon protein
MSPTLSALVALQQLDTAAEGVKRRLVDLPAVERQLDERIVAASAAVEGAKMKLTENQHARRELEKQVAQVDTRLARFEDHKAAVKTNQEFTALLHEIATAKAEKDAIEEKILLLLEAADTITAAVREAAAALTAATDEGEAARLALKEEHRQLDEELLRLTETRAREAAAIQPPLMAKYDQLLRQRRMLAVSPINGETCLACHVRLRPAVAQQVRRNEEIIQCDSCQRILYYLPAGGA